MPIFRSILCALDGSSLAPRVLRHALGLAAVARGQLTILTAVSGDLRQAEAAVLAQAKALLPPGASTAPDMRVRAVQIAMGQPVDEILDSARGADLLVAGTHSKSGLSRWLLGSTSAALLEQATCPTMLVPPGEVEIVRFEPSGPALTLGAIMAAVDLAERSTAHITVAGQIARLAHQPLVLMTVAPPGTGDDEAVRRLGEAAASAGADPGARIVVRRGVVADEIDHAAVAEHAGLVVMGLRPPEAGTPGSIADAVLQNKDAVVLAVPANWKPA